MSKLNFREAVLPDLHEINHIYEVTRKRLNKDGLLQWNSKYPNPNTFIEAIIANSMYVLEVNRELAGAVILDSNFDSILTLY